jgi:hypothetical protein
VNCGGDKDNLFKCRKLIHLPSSTLKTCIFFTGRKRKLMRKNIEQMLDGALQ